MQRPKFGSAWVIAAALWAGTAHAQGIRPHLPLGQTTGVHYASPTGVGSGPGTLAAPWTLTYALSGAGGQLTAGETVWVRGGTYSLSGTGLTVTLVGTSSAPIIVRGYPTERAILDWDISDGTNGIALAASTEYVYFWDLELRNTHGGVRVATDPATLRGHGFLISEPGIKVINCVIHDWSIGIGYFSGCAGCEVYGTLSYYHDNYGVYEQTPDSTAGQAVIDNLFFKSYGYNVHAYGTGASYHRNIRFEGNAFFSPGQIAATGTGPGFLLGGSQSATQCADNLLLNSYWYGPYDFGGGGMSSGYNGACLRTHAFGNYVFSRNASDYCTSFYDVPAAIVGGTVAAGNTICSVIDNAVGFQAAWPNNTFVNTDVAYPTTGNLIVLRPNVYEPGRAHVIVYNWTGASSVSVSLAAANFTSGDTYAIYDAQDYFGAAVASGTYSGAAVSIPMTNVSVSTPYGTVGTAPTNTAPQFGAFVVKRTNQ